MSEQEKKLVKGAAQEEYTEASANAIQKDLEAQLCAVRPIAAITNATPSVASMRESIAQHGTSLRSMKKPCAAFEKATAARFGIGVAQCAAGVALIPFNLIGLMVAGATWNIFLMVFFGAFLALGVYLFLLSLANIKLSSRMKNYVAQMGKETVFSVEELAIQCGGAPENMCKDIRKILAKGWCSLWFDERTQMLYLTQDAYRTAKGLQEAASVAQRAEQVRKEEKASESNLLQSVDNFIELLNKQSQIMEDKEAVQELERMQNTCRDIYDWLKSHPEAAPKMRRFSNYYMPTTMKLLYSYNDVQGQQGENAQAIRRDIARFLNTLNTAFDNLHDGLLSAVSMDVSAEISALQGMLAQDGLSKDDNFGAVVSLE